MFESLGILKMVLDLGRAGHEFHQSMTDEGYDSRRTVTIIVLTLLGIGLYPSILAGVSTGVRWERLFGTSDRTRRMMYQLADHQVNL